MAKWFRYENLWSVESDYKNIIYTARNGDQMVEVSDRLEGYGMALQA